jgi:exosome complex component RRP41
MPIAINPRTQEINLLQMDGELTPDDVHRGIEMVIKAGEVITKAQREALLAPYEMTSEKYKASI